MLGNRTGLSPMSVPKAALWINGQRRFASDDGTFEVRNFVTKELVGIAASATSQDCQASTYPA